MLSQSPKICRVKCRLNTELQALGFSTCIGSVCRDHGKTYFGSLSDPRERVNPNQSVLHVVYSFGVMSPACYFLHIACRMHAACWTIASCTLEWFLFQRFIWFGCSNNAAFLFYQSGKLLTKNCWKRGYAFTVEELNFTQEEGDTRILFHFFHVSRLCYIIIISKMLS